MQAAFTSLHPSFVRHSIFFILRAFYTVVNKYSQSVDKRLLDTVFSSKIAATLERGKYDLSFLACSILNYLAASSVVEFRKVLRVSEIGYFICKDTIFIKDAMIY
jgi:hypothetical protein